MENCTFNNTALTNFAKDALIFPHHDIRSTQYYLCGICLTFITYMGIVLNILSIAVFARDKPTKTTSVFLLQALAIADSIYLVMIFLRYPLPILLVYSNTVDCTFDPYTEFLALNLAYLRIPLRSTGIVAIWMVMVVTLDRYIAIYYTLKATKLCRIKTVLLEIVAVVSYATTYSVSKYLILDLYKKRIIWVFWTWDAINTLTPVIVVFILNFRIWRSLIIANRWRRETRVFSLKHRTSTPQMDSDENLSLAIRMADERSINGTKFMKVRNQVKKQSEPSKPHHSHSRRFHDNSHSDITARLIAVATTYLICESPMTILSVYIILNSWFSVSMDERTAHALFLIAHALQCINSSINFFLYFFSGRKFRKNLEDLFRCSRRRRKHSKASFRLSNANNAYRMCNSEVSIVF